MEEILKGKVVAIPSAVSASGAALIEPLSRAESRLGLGAPPLQFETLHARLDGREGTYCYPADLDRPRSVNEFFQVIFSQLGQLDIVVFEALFKNRHMAAEKAIDIGTRRFLHCLDAALPYVRRDLHFICVMPAYGPAAIPIATAFLAAKQSSIGARSGPRIRLSAISPPLRTRIDQVSFARSIVHLMREPQSPEISEAQLKPIAKRRREATTTVIKTKEKTDVTLQ